MLLCAAQRISLGGFVATRAGPLPPHRERCLRNFQPNGVHQEYTLDCHMYGKHTARSLRFRVAAGRLYAPFRYQRHVPQGNRLPSAPCARNPRLSVSLALLVPPVKIVDLPGTAGKHAEPGVSAEVLTLLQADSGDGELLILNLPIAAEGLDHGTNTVELGTQD